MVSAWPRGVSPDSAAAPRTGTFAAMRWLSAKVFDLFGWRIEGQFPDDPKLIAIGAPHTSNWDFFIFLAVIHHFRLKVRFLGKASLFRWPFGFMFRKVGGIPVERSKPGGVVSAVLDEFESSERMTLVIAPEGTRGAAEGWKSGFIEIAEAASVPVIFAGIDAPAKVVHLSEPHRVDGDREQFMDAVRDFYAPMVGIRAEGVGPVRLRRRGTRS